MNHDQARNPIERPKWVAMFAKLICPMNPVTASKAVTDMMPMMQDLPSGVFCVLSLDYVASQCMDGIPNYPKLRAALTAWWADNRPRQAAIGDQSRSDWNALDRAWLAYWYKRQSEGFDRLPDADFHGREHVLHLVASQSAKAAAYIRSEHGR